MGCDIHAAIEFRQSTNKPWEASLGPNKYFGKYEDEQETTARVGFSRDYDLFAILGNVRNGRGFAGINTGDGFEPMTVNRGVPEDISAEACAILSQGHSATWVTLAEILSYDWTRATVNRGFICAVTFLEWDWLKAYRAEPNEWSGDVSGRDVVKISAEAMKLKIDSIRGERHGRSEFVQADVVKHLANHYCLVEWPVAYSKAADQLWHVALPTMLKLGNAHGYDNVRLVMDFDS